MHFSHVICGVDKSEPYDVHALYIQMTIKTIQGGLMMQNESREWTAKNQNSPQKLGTKVGNGSANAQDS